MKSGNAVLLIEDEETLARNIAAYLRRAGYETAHAADAERGLALLGTFQPDVVLLDYNLPGIDGLTALRRIRERDARVKVIMITGHGNVRLAVDAMKASAFDYLAKPVVLAELRALVEKAIGDDRQNEVHAHARRAAGAVGLAALLGTSPPMALLRETVRQLVQGEAALRDAAPPPVLITGETGAGKEVVARAIHDEGARAARPFVEINCGSIPGNLLESELFGHERGAFTDAKERKIGLVEAAEGGTLFLDEIGDMELALQVKLLRVLEERTIRRLGSIRDRAVNVRIISATNRPLEELVAAGRFRSDLLFRLRIVALHVPPLRDRAGDALLLAGHFLERFALHYGKRELVFSPAARDAISVHAWPGNVRELRNVVEQAVLLAQNAVIDASALRLGAGFGAATVAPDAQARTLVDVERAMLQRALEGTGGNVTRAAQILGISRDTLRYRMAKFGIGRPAGAGDAASA
jgi:DNA-binding NtrC family response regulator